MKQEKNKLQKIGIEDYEKLLKDLENLEIPKVPITQPKMVKRNAKIRIKDKFRLVTKPTKTFLATMLFGNGTIKHFIVDSKDDFFKYDKKKYHLNKDDSWYDVNFHQSRLFYYEDYVEPLTKSIHCEGDTAYLKVTPRNVEPMLEQEFIKVLAESQQLTKWIKMCIFILIIVLGLSFINTLVFLLQSGILKGIMPV